MALPIPTKPIRVATGTWLGPGFDYDSAAPQARQAPRPATCSACEQTGTTDLGGV